MSAAKIGFGVAAGYLLGRTKKLKFAITVGSMLAGQRISTNPQILMKQVGELVEKNPELAKLQQRITVELLNAAKTAAIAAASSRVDAANRSLTARRDEDEDEDDYEDESDADEAQADDQADDEPDDEYQDEDGEEPEDEYEDEDGEEPEDEYEDEEGEE